MTSVGDPWHFGADPDPDPRIRTLWLLDPDPDLFLDPTTFSLILRMQKQLFFSLIFSYNLPPVTSSSDLKIKFLLKRFCVKILFCRQYFSPLNTFMRKEKDPDPDPHFWLLDPDPDPGGPKTCGSGSQTLLMTISYRIVQSHPELYFPAFYAWYLGVVWCGVPCVPEVQQQGNSGHEAGQPSGSQVQKWSRNT